VLFKKQSNLAERLEITNSCFFVPIVEQLEQDDYATSHAWNLAKSPNVLRKFYTSTQRLVELEAASLPEEATLSCYKVFLTAEQLTQLEQDQTHHGRFKGFISVSAEQIESIIVFKPHQRHTISNALYVQASMMPTITIYV
jgi:hypothetical protein